MGEPARLAPADCEDPDELDDPFRLGWRYRRVRLPDGTTEVREEPLTAEDLLDPQLGDHGVQNSWHVSTVFALFDILSSRYEASPDVLVSCDLKMVWGIRGLPGPAPDIAVIPGVRNKARTRPSFRVRQEGTRPALAIEVSSDEPEHQGNDHEKKVRIYQRARVPEYLILDLPSPVCRWTGYRLDKSGRYQPIVPDTEGRLLSTTTGLLFGISPDGNAPQVFDADTGERLLTSREVRAELNRLRQQL
jgi:Uma2 family endonuclease